MNASSRATVVCRQIRVWSESNRNKVQGKNMDTTPKEEANRDYQLRCNLIPRHL